MTRLINGIVGSLILCLLPVVMNGSELLLSRPAVGFGVTPGIGDGVPVESDFGSARLTGGLAGGKLLLVHVSIGLFAPLNINTTIRPEDAVGTPEAPIDFENALGVSPEDVIVFPEVYVTLFKRFNVRMRYEQSLADGQKILQENIVFKGTTFGISDDIKAELEDTQLKLFVEYNIINSTLLRVTGGIGANMAQTRQMIERSSDSTVAEIIESTTIPILAGEAAMNVMFFEVLARVEGLEVSGTRNWQATGGINLFLPPKSVPLIPIRGGVFIGYRYYMLDITDGKDIKKSKIEKSGGVIKLQVEIEI